MKFNWGTGIFAFLALFLIGSAAFIIFAVRQDVNLVHKDYYEKGVDYTEQMNVNARSVPYKDAFSVQFSDDFLEMKIEESLAAGIDSGNVLLFRPSNSKNDVAVPVKKSENVVLVPKKDLIYGRYILKFSWYSAGLKYEIDQPVNIQ